MSNLFLERLLKLKRLGLLNSCKSVAEIGAQQLSDYFLARRDLITEFFKEYGKDYIDLDPTFDPETSIGRQFDKYAPFSNQFWKHIGYKHIAIDVDSSPHAIPLDLNFDNCPRKYKGKYDLVCNLGTSEHICNQYQAFKVMHDLASVGGLFIHEVPAQGWFTHGLINYNMSFFWRLAKSNMYKEIMCYFDCSGYTKPLHPDYQKLATQFNYPVPDRWNREIFDDCSIFIVLQKVVDMPFTAPLDECSSSPHEILKKNYRSHFFTSKQRHKVMRRQNKPSLAARLKKLIAKQKNKLFSEKTKESETLK